MEKLRHPGFRRIAGHDIASTDSLDGFKMIFGPTTWLLVRPSGTEDLLRLYSEAPTREQVDRLLGAVVALAREEESKQKG